MKLKVFSLYKLKALDTSPFIHFNLLQPITLTCFWLSLTISIRNRRTLFPFNIRRYCSKINQLFASKVLIDNQENKNIEFQVHDLIVQIYEVWDGHEI